MTPSAILTVLVCLVGSPGESECMKFDFQPPYPMTVEQCTAQAPVAIAQITGQINTDHLEIRRWKCRIPGEDI